MEVIIMQTSINFTSLQLRKTIEAIGSYRHDNRGELPEETDEAILAHIENKLIEAYRKTRPDFVPWY